MLKEHKLPDAFNQGDNIAITNDGTAVIECFAGANPEAYRADDEADVAPNSNEAEESDD